MRTRFAPGLRTRIVAALVLTSMVTLGVAALTLLPQLEGQLRQDEFDTLETAGSAQRPAFRQLDATAPSARLSALVRTVGSRLEAQIAVVGPAGRVLASDRLLPAEATAPAVRRALRTQRQVSTTVQTDQGPESLVALPLRLRNGRGVLVVRRGQTEAAEAAAVVRRGFVVGGLVGLGVALVLGAALANRLVRRLRALRDTALRVAEIGPAAEVEAGDERDEVGDLTRALATSQDRLRAQEDARRRFVATASHELRTPLASMLLALESLEAELEDGAADPADTREQVGRARSQTERLTALTADLLDLSRIDASVPLRQEALDLTRVAAAVAAEFAGRGTRQQSRVLVDGSGECWATVDPGSAVRILRILVDNALKFAPAGTDVTIAPGGEGSTARVVVTDHGPGVAEAEADQIFERFQRGADSSKATGFGLGLAIGRELARQMDGDLYLDGTASGTAFVLTLPSA